MSKEQVLEELVIEISRMLYFTSKDEEEDKNFFGDYPIKLLEEPTLFENQQDKDERIAKVLEYIEKYCEQEEFDFVTLEKTLYAFLAMAYCGMEKMEKEEIIKIEISTILYNSRINESQKQYLEKIAEIVYEEFFCAYEEVEEHNLNIKEKRENIKDLIEGATLIYPEGEIAQSLNGINALEEFLEDMEREESREKLEEAFFDDKKCGYVFTGACEKAHQINWCYKSWIPHVKFEMGLRGKNIDIFEEKVFKSYLKLPYQISVELSTEEVVYALLDSMFKYKKLSDSKREMLSDFTHTYKNMATDNLGNIAKVLLDSENEKLKEQGRQLFVEYDNKLMLKKRIAMLNLEHTDDFEKLIKIFRNSVCHNGEGVTIKKIVSEAARRVLIRILMVAGENRVEDIRKKYEDSGITTWELMEKFEKEILKEEGESIAWISSNMVIDGNWNVTVEGKWAELCLEKKEEGSVFLSSLIMELLFNMFTYSTVQGSKTMKFFSVDEEGEEYLCIKTTNPMAATEVSYTGKGLDTREKIINKMNYGTEYKQHRSIIQTIDEEKNEFCVTVRIKWTLFEEENVG